VLERLARDFGERSARVGRRVEVDIAAAADRSDVLALQRPGLWSCNRGTRLVRAADGWIAANLPRQADREMVPAWVGGGFTADPWTSVIRRVRQRPWRELVDQARLLGLPVGGVREVRGRSADAPLQRLAAGGRRDRPPQVLDLTGLWAGPLCGGLLAQAGFSVTKIESSNRPDAMREGSPAFFERLNRGKRSRRIDFTAQEGRGELRQAFHEADVVITGARLRAFEQLGLAPTEVFTANPSLVWVAVSGYGFLGEPSDRVAFGDDAAAAGGLVRWTPSGPRFLGDALADPLTGLAAAAGALAALEAGGGLLVDAALARTAAGAAAELGLVR
jgi:hypothetical protein